MSSFLSTAGARVVFLVAIAGASHAAANSIPSYGQLPLLFAANHGQADAAVRFSASGAGYGLQFLSDAALITLSGSAPTGRESRSNKSATVRLRFIGANRAAAVRGEMLQEARSNYFFGSDASRYVTDVPNFARIRYSQMYPGIDLVYYGNQGQLEYDFELAPAADPALIALAFDGADEVSVTLGGELELHTALGKLTQHRPHIYQEVNGKRVPVEGRYTRRADRSIGIDVAAYDSSKALVIDPVLSYSSFLGGSGNDYGTAIAVDAAGSAYVTGYTASTNFPTAGAYQAALGSGATNAFVTKLNAAGTAVVYSTYLGAGSETDYASGIAVDAAGAAYITGTTSGATFPTSTIAYQKGATGGGSFVAKLGPAGNTLAYSTYILKARSNGIAVDSAGSAYVTGAASSGFVTTAGAYQASSRSTASTNAFVLKLNATGSAASFATFVGGAGTDAARGIALGSDGSAFIAGSTTSANFPLRNPIGNRLWGTQDGFVAKLNSTGTALVYSTYLGGEQRDIVNAIAVDQAGSAYVGGETYSWAYPVTPFPIKSGKGGRSIQNASVSQGSGFVSKISASGDALLYSTYLGGEYCYPSQCSLWNPPAELPSEAVHGIAVDSMGQAVVTGIVRAPNSLRIDSLITADLQATANQTALFVTKISVGGDTALYSTFVRSGPANPAATPAGMPNDAGKGIALDPSGNVYGVAEALAGFPTTIGAFRTVNAGGTDAVVFKLTSPTSSIILTPSATTITNGQTLQLTATVPDGASVGTVHFRIYRSSSNFPTLQSAPLVNGTASVSVTASAGITAASATYRNNNANLATTPLTFVVVNPAEVCN